MIPLVKRPRGDGYLFQRRPIYQLSSRTSLPSSDLFDTYKSDDQRTSCKSEHAELHVLREIPEQEREGGGRDEAFLHEPVGEALADEVLR